MKKLLSILMCVSLLSVGLYSCGDDDDDDGGGDANKVKLTATFKYQTKDGDTKPSFGTKMYIFKTNGEVTADWQYNTTTNYYERKDGTVVYPTYTFQVNENGVINQEIEDKISYTYVYRPAIDPAVWGADSFETKGQPIVIEKTHGLTN